MPLHLRGDNRGGYGGGGRGGCSILSLRYVSAYKRGFN